MSASKRQILIHTPLGKEKLLLGRFSVREELGRPFRIEAELLSRDHDIVLDRLVGEPVCIALSLGGGKHRYFHGVVSTFVQVDPVGRFAGYRATIVPWLWLLTRTADCRIFQEKTVPEIIKEVFKEYGFADVADKLRGSYKPWTYCVQYRESDFNFVSRLMEQEGIYYFWRHSEDKHEMVLVDSPAAHDPFPGYEKIPYRPEQGSYTGGEDIASWIIRQQMQPGIYALGDYNFEKPKVSLMTKKAQSKQKAGKKWEVFDYPGEYDEYAEGEAYAKIRIEELQAQHEVATGLGDSRGISAGCQFTLQRHPRKDQNRKYLVTSCDYTVADEQHEAGEGTFELHCTFNAIDAAQAFRPQRITPKPVIQGPQTAVVTGPAGEEIYVDDLGRVKVQFHWDRYGKKDQNSSCWIRTSHPWAGKGFGGMAVPRMGQEVIVEFLEGDPDQPIINGRIYNADQVPHGSNAGRKTPGPANFRQAAMMTSLKSNSLGGSGGHNEITMNDTGGAEGLFIKAQKDETHLVGNNREDTVTNNETLKVGVDRSRDVGANETIKIGVNQDITVGTNQTEKIGVNQSLTVGIARTQQVMVAENVMTGVIKSCQTGVAHMDIVGVARAEITGVARFTLVGVTDKLVVTGARSETISKDRTVTVKKNSVIEATENNTIKAGKDAFLEAGANCGIKAAAMMIIECPDITLKAGGGFIRIDAAGITIQGTVVNINSGGAPGVLPAPPSPSAAPAASGSAGSGGAGAGAGAGSSAAGGAAGASGAAGAATGAAAKVADSPLVGVLKDLGVGENTAKMLEQIATDPMELKMDQVTAALPSAKQIIDQIPSKILPDDAKAALNSVIAMATGTPEEAEAAAKALAKQAKDKVKAEAKKQLDEARDRLFGKDKDKDKDKDKPKVSTKPGDDKAADKPDTKPPSPQTGNDREKK